MVSTELYHEGVKGMRWGVRRYQNKDGTRTPAGKKRENRNTISDDDLKSKVNRLNLEKRYKDLKKETSKPSKMEKAKKAVDATSSLVNKARELSRDTVAPRKEKMNLSNMTDKQLRDRINRTNLERQYNDMFAPTATVSKGKRYLSNIIETAGATLALGSSALAIAVAIKELRG